MTNTGAKDAALAGAGEARPGQARQQALFNISHNAIARSLWDRQHHYAALRELFHALPRGLGLETTDGRTWRVITVTAEMRDALERLEAVEGEVIPPLERQQAAVRRVIARDMEQQARAVLRSVQLQYEIEAVA